MVAVAFVSKSTMKRRTAAVILMGYAVVLLALPMFTLHRKFAAGNQSAAFWEWNVTDFQAAASFYWTAAAVFIAIGIVGLISAHFRE